MTGYEIHHGVVTAAGGEPFPGGCSAGAVLGTTWHGIFESDGFRRALLRRVAAAAGRSLRARVTSRSPHRGSGSSTPWATWSTSTWTPARCCA